MSKSKRRDGTRTYRDGHIGIFQCTKSYPTDFGTNGHWVLDSILLGISFYVLEQT